MNTVQMYLPRTVHVAQWFGQNGRTLTDVMAFRSMIAAVREEVSAVRGDIFARTRAALLDEVVALDEALRQADALVERMERRIAELGERPDPLAAAARSISSAFLAAYGDDSIELGWL